MGTSRRRLSLRVAALTFSAIGAVLMGYGGATGAAVGTRPTLLHASTADTEAHERRCAATPTPAARRGHDDQAHCGHAGHDSHHERDRERSHVNHDHGSHGSSAHDQDRSPAGAGHLTGAETRDPGCGDADNGDTNCSGESGADRGTAHRPSAAATGRVPVAAPAPANHSGGAASSAGRPAPLGTETTTTSSLSAGVSASAVPAGGSHSPVVPVAGTVAGIGAGLLLCLAGLVGLALARRPSRRP
jgi:hypothetical protein